MALPERYSLTIEQGATLKIWWALKYPDGTIADLGTAGYTTGRLTVRPDYGEDAVLSLTTDNGGVVISYETDADGRQWSGYLYASATATAALTEWGEGIYDLEISNGTDVIRVMQGPATLSPEATI